MLVSQQPIPEHDLSADVRNVAARRHTLGRELPSAVYEGCYGFAIEARNFFLVLDIGNSARVSSA